jgi:hypothetical protein
MIAVNPRAPWLVLLNAHQKLSLRLVIETKEPGWVSLYHSLDVSGAHPQGEQQP